MDTYPVDLVVGWRVAIAGDHEFDFVAGGNRTGEDMV
jgi:hypothetical protein